MVGHQGVISVMMIGACTMLSSATILSPLKVDPSSLHLYKTGLRNELDYILKRGAAVQGVEESPDSKERRSQMGSSFIRFGRSDGNAENPDYSSSSFNDIDSSASRIPRGRSDVIIRFGRAGRKLEDLVKAHGKMVRVLPLDLEQLSFICPDVLASDSDNAPSELTRLCASLARGDDGDKNN